MQQYSRPLNNREDVEDFLIRVLQYRHPKINKIIPKIIEGQIGIEAFLKDQTINASSMRVANFRDEVKRWKLREQIIDELFSLKRLPNDDDIRLKKGGSIPKSGIKSQKKAFLLIGLPASGKSSIASAIADEYGAVILDSDYAKRKLPEFDSHVSGASLVHEESDQITFGFSTSNPNAIKSLYERCIKEKYNVIIPKIGQNPSTVIDLVRVLKEKNDYEVHLILVSLSKQQSTIRAINRFYTSNRYVPLALIFDWYGNDPSHSYYYLRCKHPDLFKSFGVISTLTKDPTCTDVQGNSPAKKYNFSQSILTLP